MTEEVVWVEAGQRFFGEDGELFGTQNDDNWSCTLQGVLGRQVKTQYI